MALDAVLTPPSTHESIGSVMHHTGLRKNGKPQSCEPCRKSKLACDHSIPCGRCARLQRSAQCIYDPAPKASAPASKRRKVTSSEDGLTRTLEHQTSNVESATDDGSLPKPISENGRRPFWSADLPRKAGMRYEPGFQGKTAFSAILNEYEPSLDQGNSSSSLTSSALVETEIDPQCIELGAEILSYLPQPKSASLGLKRYLDRTVSVTLHLPSIVYFDKYFWSRYGQLLNHKRSPETLARCARAISVSAIRKPFPNSFTSTNNYLEATVDRWEMIGTLFSCFANLDFMLGPDQMLELLPRGIKPNDFSRCMLWCAEGCLRLVDQLDTGLNILTATLSRRCCALRGFVTQRSDTNHVRWSHHIQLVGDATALGLHRLPEPAMQHPASLLFYEQQKRVFVCAFTHDKHMAVFLGRPPALSKRYVTTTSLLDIDDDTLMQDDLAKVKSSLDEHGYNRSGLIHRPTFLRAMYEASFIYEDILELSLGAAPVDHSRIQTIKAQMETQYAQQPGTFHETVNRELFSRGTIFRFFAIIEVQLTHLHQNFLLDRIQYGTESLHFGTVEDMLRIVLTLWTEREHYPGHKDDIHWIICCHGIPAASALAVGLWKASDAVRPNLDSWRNSRSENVQNLSLFIAALDWIKPADGNYGLCQRTMGMLKSILDRILAPAQVTPLPMPSDDYANWDLDTFSLAGMPNFGVGMEDLFEAGWMNAPRAGFS